MARSTRIAITVANLEAAALAARCNNGWLRIYTGGQPANPEAAVSGTLLATLRFAATAFGAPANGVLTAAAIASVVASGSGTPGWFRAFESDGTTPVFDGSCGVQNQPQAGDRYDMELAAASIAAGVNVSIASLTYTVSRAA